MRFRFNDNKAGKLFANHKVPLLIFDTLLEGHNIHYAVSGIDTLPTLVFIHGSPGSWVHYMKFMWDDSLRKKFRFISIDRPGFGYSEFGKPMHLKEQSEILLRIIAANQNSKPIFLAGHSIGGPVVAQMAAMSPGSFEKIIIMSGSISPYLEKKEKWRHLMNNSVMRMFLPGAFAPSNTEILWFKKDLFQLEKELANINTKVVFVHGDKDTWVPIENIKYGMEKMIHAKSFQSDTLHGANHMIPWNRMEEVKKILQQLY
jgi:pimeloyl-ACP methyl ester carboxylesterase